jgi:hypothetical protein
MILKSIIVQYNFAVHSLYSFRRPASLPPCGIVNMAKQRTSLLDNRASAVFSVPILIPQY